MTNSNFQNWAKEINKDWTLEYRSDVRDSELRIYLNNLLIATVDAKLEIEMHEYGHENAIQQLEYMITR